MLQLYRACTVPAGHFACEIWGVLPMRARQARSALTTLQLQHLKRLVGLWQSSSTPILLARWYCSMPRRCLIQSGHKSGFALAGCPRCCALDYGGLHSGYVAGY